MSIILMAMTIATKTIYSSFLGFNFDTCTALGNTLDPQYHCLARICSSNVWYVQYITFTKVKDGIEKTVWPFICLMADTTPRIIGWRNDVNVSHCNWRYGEVVLTMSSFKGDARRVNGLHIHFFRTKHRYRENARSYFQKEAVVVKSVVYCVRSKVYLGRHYFDVWPYLPSFDRNLNIRSADYLAFHKSFT